MRVAGGDDVLAFMCGRHRKAVWRCANGNKMLQTRESDKKKQTNIDFKCAGERLHRTSEKAMRLRHHVGLHSVLRD